MELPNRDEEGLERSRSGGEIRKSVWDIVTEIFLLDK